MMAERNAASGLRMSAATQRYLREIRGYPLLDAETEQALARRWLDQRDADAQRQLVNSHLKLVVKLAMQFRRYPVAIDDLISEGTVGLMQAIDRFDPDRGFRLSTFAMWWIRAAITEFVIRSWSLVRIGTTAEQKKLFFNLRKTKARLHAYEDGDLSRDHVHEIAQDLAVAESDVVMMNGRLAGQDASLNIPREGGDAELQDWLADERENQEDNLAEHEEQAYRRDLLRRVLGDLTERERAIIVDRHLCEEPMTLETLSRRLGISRERVRQIESAAITKIKRSMARQDPTVPHTTRRKPTLRTAESVALASRFIDVGGAPHPS